MAASVLFDQPGPRALARHRTYSIGFAVLVLAFLAWVVYKFNAAGEFEPLIWQRLFSSNVWREILSGLIATLKAAGVAIVLSVLLGFLLAVGRLSEKSWIRIPAVAVIEFLRAVPVLLMMIFLFYFFADHGSMQRETRAFVAVVGGLTLYNGAVLAEVFRAGIGAVPKGQSEAAYAVGMRKYQVMTGILTPQAVRFMLPAIISQCVVALKDTSLGLIVTYTELLRSSKIIATYVGSTLMTFLLVALIYIAINSLLSLFAQWLERRLATRGDAEAAKAVEKSLPVG